MSGDGVTVSGGGSIAVDTPAMQRAARLLDTAQGDFAAMAVRISALLHDPRWNGAGGQHRARTHLQAALGACRSGAEDARAAAGGLRTAALRYGAVEAGVEAVVRATAGGVAAVAGSVLSASVALLGPSAAVLAAEGAAAAGADLLALAALRELVTTGHIDPQIDPAVLAGLRLALSSSDDLLRGLLLAERPEDLVLNDPGGPYGTEAIAAAAAGMLPVPSGALVTSASTEQVPGPRSLAALAERVPESRPATPQVRIEEYRDPDGSRRWIVYVTGTVTFAPDGGPEPFDLRADVLGVAGRESDSEGAVRAAMAAAGVAPQDPVLLVGHSQGALDATRIAERGGYRIAGLVTLGGPTGQIPLAATTPVLAVEHAEDPVPALGGLAAAGAAGAARVVVRRSLYADTPPPGAPLLPFSAGAAPHALEEYGRTLALAERSPDPRIGEFQRRIAPFLNAAPGRSTLERVDRVRPPRGRSAGGTRDR